MEAFPRTELFKDIAHKENIKMNIESINPLITYYVAAVW